MRELRTGSLSRTRALTVLDSDNAARARSLLAGLLSDQLVANSGRQIYLADG